MLHRTPTTYKLASPECQTHAPLHVVKGIWTRLGFLRVSDGLQGFREKSFSITLELVGMWRFSSKKQIFKQGNGKVFRPEEAECMNLWSFQTKQQVVRGSFSQFSLWPAGRVQISVPRSKIW